jgi:hypothetical protein
MAFIKVDFPTLVYYKRQNHSPDYRVVYPFVCQSLWFYLSINSITYYVCQFQFLFPQVHAFQFPFWRSNASTFKAFSGIGIVPTLLGFWHTTSLLFEISRIRCVLSRILHSTITLEIFFVMEITHHQISMWKFHSLYILMDFFYFSGSYKCFGIWSFHFCEKRLTTCPPVKVRNSNSSRYSLSFSSLWFWVTIQAVFRNLILLF